LKSVIFFGFHAGIQGLPFGLAGITRYDKATSIIDL